MLDIKKYSNGKYFDTINQKYVNKDRIKEYIKKGEKLKITLTTTGEDITSDMISRFSQKTAPVALGSSIPGDLKKWVSDTVDRRIKQILDIMNLPTVDQMKKLDADIKSLDKKIQALEEKWQTREVMGPTPAHKDENTTEKPSISEQDAVKKEDRVDGDKAQKMPALKLEKDVGKETLFQYVSAESDTTPTPSTAAGAKKKALSFDDLLSDVSGKSSDEKRGESRGKNDTAFDEKADDTIKASASSVNPPEEPSKPTQAKKASKPKRTVAKAKDSAAAKRSVKTKSAQKKSQSKKS